MARGHRLRIGRASEEGRVYLITICCFERRPIFDNIGNWLCLARALGELSAETRTWCYVAMPDHFHWLMQLVDGAGLSRCVQKFKGRVTREIRRGGSLRGEVWQRGFHDRALRREEDMKSVARYVIANPVRAGLVRSVRNYPFWDAAWL